MGERDDAKRSIESTRARIGVLAHEVSRRMTPAYAKERAKEMARYKASEVRDRATESPWVLPLVGAGIGALVGRAFVGRIQERRARAWDERGALASRRDGWGRGETYEVWSGEDPGVAPIDELEGDTGLEIEDEERRGLRARAEDAGEGLRDRAADLKDRAADLKDRAADKASEVRDRLGAKAGEVRERVRHRAGALRERIPAADDVRASAEQNPAVWALGAMALGALFGMLVPVGERERRALAPAKEKVRQVSQQAAEKVSDQVSERLGSTGASGQGPAVTGGPMAPSPGGGPGGPDVLPPEPLH